METRDRFEIKRSYSTLGRWMLTDKQTCKVLPLNATSQREFDIRREFIARESDVEHVTLYTFTGGDFAISRTGNGPTQTRKLDVA